MKKMKYIVLISICVGQMVIPNPPVSKELRDHSQHTTQAKENYKETEISAEDIWLTLTAKPTEEHYKLRDELTDRVQQAVKNDPHMFRKKAEEAVSRNNTSAAVTLLTMQKYIEGACNIKTAEQIKKKRLFDAALIGVCVLTTTVIIAEVIKDGLGADIPSKALSVALLTLPGVGAVVWAISNYII